MGLGKFSTADRSRSEREVPFADEDQALNPASGSDVSQLNESVPIAGIEPCGW